MSRFGARLRGSSPVSTWLRGGAGSLRSVQYGSIALGAAASNTATIAAVDLTRAVVLFLGKSNTSVDASEISCRITLTNATTVTAERVGTTDVALTVAFVVLEFAPGSIKQVTRGTITIPDAANTNTATIAAVDTTKTWLCHLGQSFNTAGTQPGTYWDCRLTLTNATTVTATRGGNSAGLNPTVGYQVVEFY